jgi:hypothetical protein
MPYHLMGNKIKNLIINTSTKRNKHHALTKLLVNVTLLGPKPQIKCKYKTKDNCLMYKQTSSNPAFNYKIRNTHMP